MIKNSMIVIQIILFLVGVCIIAVSGADGTWESATFATYFGMVVCLLSLVLHLVVSFIEKFIK